MPAVIDITETRSYLSCLRSITAPNEKNLNPIASKTKHGLIISTNLKSGQIAPSRAGMPHFTGLKWLNGRNHDGMKAGGKMSSPLR